MKGSLTTSKESNTDWLVVTKTNAALRWLDREVNFKDQKNNYFNIAMIFNNFNKTNMCTRIFSVLHRMHL